MWYSSTNTFKYPFLTLFVKKKFSFFCTFWLSAVQCSASAVQCSAVQCSAVQCSADWMWKSFCLQRDKNLVGKDTQRLVEDFYLKTCVSLAEIVPMCTRQESPAKSANMVMMKKLTILGTFGLVRGLISVLRDLLSGGENPLSISSCRKLWEATIAGRVDQLWKKRECSIYLQPLLGKVKLAGKGWGLHASSKGSLEW